MSTISLAGIDKAISGLGYRNQKSLKCRFVQVIRRYYDSEEAIARLRSIDSGSLIRFIWQIDETDVSIQLKQKNFQSIKTSVNNDLMELFEKGDNPEGIIVGPSNIFVMSHQAKDKLLQSFAGSVKAEGDVNLSKIAEVLNIIREALSDTRPKPNNQSEDEIDKIKAIIKALSNEIGVSTGEEVEVLVEDETPEAGIEGAGGLTDDEDLEEITEDELEERSEADVVESDDGAGAGDADVGEEVEVLVEDEAPEAGIEGAGGLTDDEDLEEITEDELEERSEADAAESDDGAGAGDADVGEEVEILVEEEEPGAGIEELEDIEDKDQAVNTMETSDPLTSDLSLDHDQDQEFGLDAGSGIAKGVLAEQFSSYLGAMDRYYNQYILVPAGDFIIGSKEPEGDERQEDKIFLQDFYISKYPITNALFEVFIERTGYQTTAEKLGYGTVFQGRFLKIPDNRAGFDKSVWNATCGRKIVKGACWYQPFGPGSTLNKKRNHPVVQVSYIDASAFAAWTGKRLPTESEWEAAARTQAGLLFPWGNEWREEVCNTEECSIADTTPVDQYNGGTNDYGVADSLGNVLEWTADECVSLYSNNRDITYRIAKGGSWISDSTVRLFSRFRFESKFTSNILGFRCIAD